MHQLRELTECIQTETSPCLASSASHPCRRTNSRCAERRSTFPLQTTAAHTQHWQIQDAHHLVYCTMIEHTQ